MNDTVWIDGPSHPDMFDGETPIREEVSVEDFGLSVFKVECTYYVEEEQAHFVVASSYAEAEDKVWEQIQEEPTVMDKAEVTKLELHEELISFMRPIFGNNHKTAREMLEAYITENQIEYLRT